MTDVREANRKISQSNLIGALLAVQAHATTLPKDKTATIPTKTGGSYQYRYTDLATIVEKVGPLLAEHGLVWMAFPSGTEDAPMLKYSLLHPESGEGVHGEMPLLLGDKVDSQALGSAITYARRYALTAVLNLVADDDDDGGQAASNGADRFTSPTDKQLKYLKTLVTKSGAPVRTLRAMLDTVQAQDIEITEGWTGRLTREQVSRLIELFKAGSLPDPEAVDVPTDDPPVVEPVGDDQDLPFDAVGAEHES